MKQKLKKYITSKLDLIISAKLRCSKSVEHYYPTGGQFDPKIPQKHPIFRGGPAPPKSHYFSKRVLPRDFSPRKPPIYKF